jgi:signal transduction histidine kinase
MSTPGPHPHGPWDGYPGGRPFGRPPGSGGSRLLRLWVPVVISFVLQVPAVFFVWHMSTRSLVPSAQSTGILLLSLVIALAGPLALIGARRFPGPVVAITAVAASADLLLHGTSDGPPYVALAFAIVSAIVRGARIWAWIAVSACWVLTLIVSIVIGISWQPFRLVGITLGILLVMGIGEAVRTRRERYEEISRRVAQRKQSEVQAERVRIARELHDVLAHSLSQINVQAGVGLHLMEKQPERAADALASIKETSKTALDEVRSVLGVLRAEGGADPSAPLVPEPDLSRLPGLIASVESQGLHVEFSDDLQRQPSAAVQLALYRIVQESLTNALRHAKATTVTVRLAEDDDGYLLTVNDDGVGPATPRSESGGRGLLGMQERAELLGGSLQAGGSPDGGFELIARIPIPRRGPE